MADSCLTCVSSLSGETSLSTIARIERTAKIARIERTARIEWIGNINYQSPLYPLKDILGYYK